MFWKRTVLTIGMTLVSFHSLGSLPSTRDLSKIIAKIAIGDNSKWGSLSTLAAIESGPGALSGFSWYISLSSPHTVMVRASMGGCGLGPILGLVHLVPR